MEPIVTNIHLHVLFCFVFLGRHACHTAQTTHVPRGGLGETFATQLKKTIKHKVHAHF